MYVPALFEETRPDVIAAFLADHPMAQLVTMTEAGLTATPLPMLYEPAPDGDGMGSLVGHVARANRQWSQASATIEALAIFTGPNAYVSPNWYPSKAEHGKVVPTWNYETVHIRGTFVAHDDPVWTRALVTRLTECHESTFAAPWHVTDAPADYVDSMVRGIVGVEVRISSIQAKRKLSQNRPAEDAASVVVNLAALGGESARVAATMRTLEA